MSAVTLSPAGALAWLRSLSVDLRACAVLGPDRALLAGDPDLARRAAAMFDPVAGARGESAAETGAGTATATVAEARDGAVLAVRSERHTVAADVGPRALERLVWADLRAALAAVDGS